MRLPDDVFVRHARRYALVLILVPALAGCGSHDTLASAASGAAATTGPAADYPMVTGEPYRVGAALYTPGDTMNYNEVGCAAADSGSGVTGSHHTLPLPSYVEVTSLVTGKTILVRLVRRGRWTAMPLLRSRAPPSRNLALRPAKPFGFAESIRPKRNAPRSAPGGQAQAAGRGFDGIVA